ncbi:hypothetical protein [Streptomyces abikoensis]|uniref:hypothetical protein n=1 Tax=Streptomyces abikoensis TaxID=97398 RepID=UPI0016796CFF|nr:hypothetical protein [Streptomyces abikoensis]GGP34125.1 hypothetical protein GCM10010214_02940 [Streptomyces abikoensis]
MTTVILMYGPAYGRVLTTGRADGEVFREAGWSDQLTGEEDEKGRRIALAFAD